MESLSEFKVIPELLFFGHNLPAVEVPVVLVGGVVDDVTTWADILLIVTEVGPTSMNMYGWPSAMAPIDGTPGGIPKLPLGSEKGNPPAPGPGAGNGDILG